MKRGIISFLVYFVIVSFAILWIQSFFIYSSSSKSEDNTQSASSYSDMEIPQETDNRENKIGTLGWAISAIGGVLVSTVMVVSNETVKSRYSYSRYRRRKSSRRLAAGNINYSKYSRSIYKI